MAGGWIIAAIYAIITDQSLLRLRSSTASGTAGLQ
jgi:hypothetical protein